MKKTVGLTDSEWKIMQLLWQSAPLTITQLERALKADTGWTKHTVISFLKRMLAKEAIYVVESQPARLYFPNIDKDEAVLGETRSALGKLYGGNVGLMISSLVRQENMSDEDIDALMETLRASKRGKGEGGND